MPDLDEVVSVTRLTKQEIDKAEKMTGSALTAVAGDVITADDVAVKIGHSTFIRPENIPRAVDQLREQRRFLGMHHLPEVNKTAAAMPCAACNAGVNPAQILLRRGDDPIVVHETCLPTVADHLESIWERGDDYLPDVL